MENQILTRSENEQSNSRVVTIGKSEPITTANTKSAYSIVEQTDNEETKYQHQHLSTTSIANSFVLWVKLLWEKKKIYWALLPHFFDQATDLGVILEYYDQRNEDIGIDTINLFYASIAILVLHRIVSSIAVYSITKSKLDVCLQLFDMLAVKCVWISHILGIKEPTNPQRYLQIFESIFEVKLCLHVHERIFTVRVTYIFG